MAIRLFTVLLSLSVQLNLISSTYDLIDPTPRCYTLGLCDEYGVWGTYTAIHPNSEEKTQMTLINLARMYPSDYQSSPYGSHIYGTYGGSWSYDSGENCGDSQSIPYWWQSDANQASRFGEWDCLNCHSSCGHSTCSDPDRGNELFNGDYGFGTRCNSFVNQYSMSCSAEGLCGANMCYTDGHCGAMFNPNSYIFGVGFSPGANGITISYINVGDYNIDYPIVNVCHFDERIKVNSGDYNVNGYLTFMLQWFDNSESASNVYIAYNGHLSEMSLAYGNSNNGFYQLNDAIPDECSPYYFIVKTTNNDYYRMPESDDFMYGTAWSNWSWWKPDGSGNRPNRCEENHYYLYNDATWVANGGDNTGISSSSGCVGCNNAYSIANYWDDFTGGTATDPPTEKPTTPSPTVVSDPTKYQCNDGCLIPTSYQSDSYCDCSTCEDEQNWTCDTCGNSGGLTCDYIAESCGNYMFCHGVTPAPTDGGSKESTTPQPTQDPTRFYCGNGCDIPISYQNDNYCDCANDCADESSWFCATCGNSAGKTCDDISTCGDYMYCDGQSGYIVEMASYTVRSDSVNTDENSDTTNDDDDDSTNDSNNSNSNSNSGGIDFGILIAIIGGCIVIFLIALGLILYFKCYKNNNNKINKNGDKNGLLSNDENYAPPQVKLVETQTADHEDASDKRVY